MDENQWDEPSAGDNKQAAKQEGNWERDVLEKIALAGVTEQRRARRWGIFFKSLMCLYLIAILGVSMYPMLEKSMGSEDGEGHTAVINITGVIAEGTPTNAGAIIQALRNAVKNEDTKGIILHANSPGGSPVQSSYIYNEIKKIKKENPEMPIYAVASDI